MDIILEEGQVGTIPIRAINVLAPFSRPVIDDAKALYDNAYRILSRFSKSVCFVGQGTSGCTILTAMKLITYSHQLTRGPRGVNHRFIVFPKQGVSSSTFTQPLFHNKDEDIVVVDDHIHIGRTIDEIREQLDYLSMVLCLRGENDLILRVKAIAANEWRKPISEESSNRESINDGFHLIRSTFPKCELWFH